MAVDVEELRSFCSFGPDRVYLLVAIARRKENPETSHRDPPTIREIVEGPADLRRKVDQLDHAVSRFKERYRLYLSVNARDTLGATFELRRRMDDWLEMRLHGNDEVAAKFRRVDSEFKSVLQSDRCSDESYFIFDLDDASAADADRLRERLAAETTVELVRETPNGYHLVTAPFDYTDLTTTVEYELKTDGLLFCSYIGEA
ncbi:hypothetical protein NDI56_04430 [Haloarcula sp. S1CR25-12]|uniref:Uncharacterized protein n=1 Tax=Haloarcula saliterrae TaxID=2950534 RepID=A0ABU2F8P1_9EURY|nr:hypothetical protein [Haloarcula sp. S1CR25-12]MDS0258658.1 hypothetical protein [Haloarcula sp. S1CR25-12]